MNDTSRKRNATNVAVSFAARFLFVFSVIFLFSGVGFAGGEGGFAKTAGRVQLEEPPTSQPRGKKPGIAPELTPITAEVEEYFRGKLREAREHFDRRNYSKSFRIADAILAVAPTLSFIKEVQALRRQAEGRHLAGSVLMVTFEEEGDRDYPRRSVKGHAVFKNISGTTITVGRLNKKAIIGQSNFQVTESYLDGSEWTTIGTKNLTAKGFKLEPDQEHRIPFEAEFPRGPRDPMAQSMMIQGQLLPAGIKIEGEEVPRAMPWLVSKVRAVPRDLATCADDPRMQLQVALLTEDLRRAVVAGSLWARELDETRDSDKARYETVDLLIKSLDSAPQPMERVILALLTEMTNLTLRSRREWQEWHAIGEDE